MTRSREEIPEKLNDVKTAHAGRDITTMSHVLRVTIHN